MYLIIHEDGSLETASSLKQDTYQSADDGYIDIIDVTDGIPLQYFENDWIKI